MKKIIEFIKRLFGKLFLSNNYFTIAIRKKTRGIVESNSFEAEFVKKATLKKWAADPMLVDCGDKTYLFYEAVDYIKGRIEVCRVNDDCTMSEPQIILEDECHYSYPFVFSYKDVWYMIPESSQSGEVRLYKAVEFPNRWEITEVLLNGKYVDTTVFEYDGELYLTTYETNGKTECVEPSAFRMKLDGSRTELEKLEWNDYDTLRVRGAGAYFAEGNKTYRPAQISSDYKYGDGIVFCSVEIDGNAYKEVPCAELKPDSIKAKKAFIDGAHTYTVSKSFEAIDIRCRDFDATKAFRRIIKQIKK